jgi:hypothetical protein
MDQALVRSNLGCTCSSGRPCFRRLFPMLPNMPFVHLRQVEVLSVINAPRLSDMFDIRAVFRIDNSFYRNRFDIRACTVEQLRGDANIVYGFHATDICSVSDTLVHGFSRRFFREGPYGRGIYASTDFKKADWINTGDMRAMLVVEIIAG